MRTLPALFRILPVLALLLASGAVRAQAPMPAYQDKLERLSEVLGALHYLRGLCANGEDQIWRNRMSALIEAEANTDERRARMTRAFNHGYNGFAESYLTCTPSARHAADRYRREGINIARDISSQYAE